ncbi:MAG: hypothetical protein JHC31_13730 [Sulfurihydrogenibium sp.]|jgi:hypothetical protein|nr:hypothetical protein [Sulfurihydrogenibium sp.]
MNDIANYYASKFNTIKTKLNPKETEALEELSQKYSYEELIKAIDNLPYRPKPTELKEKIIQVLNNKNTKQQQEKQQEKKEEEKEEKQKPQRLTPDDILNRIPENYKQIFIQYKIPKKLIDVNLFLSLDKYLKNVYLSDIIAEYIYNKLPKEKLAQYNKKAEKHLSKTKISEKEKEEARKIYTKLLIKKDLGIYV